MKKINSEIKVNNSNFKIKVGTTDKKNPSIIYIEIGSYITPLKESDSYSKEIEEMRKSIKKHLLTVLPDKNFIFTTDVASDRMAKGKKSYLEMQLHMRTFYNNEVKYFENMVGVIRDTYLTYNIIPYIENRLKEQGFEYSKTKN